MTAYELRHHLRDRHQIRMLGADYGTLLTVHDQEHRIEGQDHDHGERDVFAGGAVA